MRIQGNYREFRFLINTAIQLKGEFMYFTPEGDLWLLYNGGKTFYLKTNLDISHHTILNWETIENVNGAIIRMKVAPLLRDEENFFCMKPELLQLGRFGDHQLKVRFNMEQARMYSQFVRKFQELEFLPELPGTPQLFLEASLIEKYAKDIRRHNKEFGSGFNGSSVVRAGADEYQNIVQLGPDENLWFLRKSRKKGTIPKQTFVYEEGFYLKEEYWEFPFYLSDSDIGLMLQLRKHEHIDEFRLLLYRDFYIIDTYGSDVQFKMWTGRKKAKRTQVLL